MEVNVGKTDRMIRAGLAIIFAVLGVFVSPWFYVFTVILLVTAVSGFCLIYKPFGINTSKKPGKK
jgi:hypothetical protein